MTTTVPILDSRHDARASATPAERLTRRRVVASEWIKLRSLRSPYWLLAVTVLGIVGSAAFAAVGVVVAGLPPDADPTGGALAGIGFAQLLVGALGVLTVTGEYATGTIRATFTAVPGRLPVLVGKAVALAAVTAGVALASAVVGFFTAAAILSTVDGSLSPTAPGVPRALVGAALFLAVVGLLGQGLGWLLRGTAGALTALLGVMVVLPVLALLLPRQVADAVIPYLPNNAGAAVMQPEPGPGALPPWTGLGVFALYAVVVLAVAALVLRRRDA